MSVEEKVKSIIANVFDVEYVLNDEMNASDVDGWDSLSHVTVILMIERSLDIQMTDYERGSVDNIGDLVKLCAQKVSAKSK